MQDTSEITKVITVPRQCSRIPPGTYNSNTSETPMAQLNGVKKIHTIF